MMIDFTGYQIDSFRAYDGANGSKICVLYQGERWKSEGLRFMTMVLVCIHS